jgi:hypothetical protein
MATNSQFPSKASLVSQYVGRSLHDIPLPAAVIDISAVKRNCQGMLRLKSEGNAGVDFLSLVETHKVRGSRCPSQALLDHLEGYMHNTNPLSNHIHR